MNEGPGIVFEGCTFTGVGLGRLVTPGTKVVAIGNLFRGVERPFDIEATEVVAVANSIRNDPKGGRRKRSSQDKSYAAIPAFCPNCKSVFASANYTVRTPQAFLSANTETCPVCGSEDANLSEGAFDLAAEFVRVIAAPSFTYDLLARLSEILGEVEAGRLTVVQAAHQIEADNPTLAALLLRVARDPAVATIIALLGILISAAFAVWAGLKEPTQPFAPPVTFGSPAAVIKQLPGPVRPSAHVNSGCDEQTSANPPNQKSLLEPRRGMIKKSTRAIVNAVRRTAIRNRRLEFGAARHGGPRCWGDRLLR